MKNTYLVVFATVLMLTSCSTAKKVTKNDCKAVCKAVCK